MWNLIGGFGFVAVAIAGVISGIVTKQPSLIMAGSAFVVIGAIGVIKGFSVVLRGGNRDSAVPDEKFFIMDVGGSPGIFAACVVLFIAAVAGFIIFPPTHAYW